MRERTMNLKIYSRALRVRRMGSHCSPRLETSRYLFNTDISFLGEIVTEKGKKKEERWRGKGGGKKTSKLNPLRQIFHLFPDVPQVGNLITNSIFHFHKAKGNVQRSESKRAMRETDGSMALE